MQDNFIAVSFHLAVVIPLTNEAEADQAANRYSADDANPRMQVPAMQVTPVDDVCTFIFEEL